MHPIIVRQPPNMPLPFKSDRQTPKPHFKNPADKPSSHSIQLTATPAHSNSSSQQLQLAKAIMHKTWADRERETYPGEGEDEINARPSPSPSDETRSKSQIPSSATSGLSHQSSDSLPKFVIQALAPDEPPKMMSLLQLLIDEEFPEKMARRSAFRRFLDHPDRQFVTANNFHKSMSPSDETRSKSQISSSAASASSYQSSKTSSEFVVQALAPDEPLKTMSLLQLLIDEEFPEKMARRSVFRRFLDHSDSQLVPANNLHERMARRAAFRRFLNHPSRQFVPANNLQDRMARRSAFLRFLNHPDSQFVPANNLQDRMARRSAFLRFLNDPNRQFCPANNLYETLL